MCTFIFLFLVNMWTLAFAQFCTETLCEFLKFFINCNGLFETVRAIFVESRSSSNSSRSLNSSFFQEFFMFLFCFSLDTLKKCWLFPFFSKMFLFFFLCPSQTPNNSFFLIANNKNSNYRGYYSNINVQIF